LPKSLTKPYRPTEGDDGVACKHGPGECLGNMLELCAASLYPDPKISLGFTMCLSNDYEHIPDQDLIESCALEHSVDFSKLNHCVSRDDGYGIKLLRESMERSAEAGIKTSCTVSELSTMVFNTDADRAGLFDFYRFD
jgi:hypothetical protein